MPYHNPTVKRATMAHHNLLELVGMCKFDAISTTDHSRPVVMNAKAGNYQGFGSGNHARQDFGTRLDAGPGSFSTIKFGKPSCPSGTNFFAARVPNLVQMAAGQYSIEPYRHFCTIRPSSSWGGDATQSFSLFTIEICSRLCVKEFERISFVSTMVVAETLEHGYLRSGPLPKVP